MLKFVRNKWVVLLVCIILFVLLDLQVRNVTLSQRGIVLGIGIDKQEEGYQVTSEILAPSNLGAENYQKNRLLSTETGKTLEEAFEKMDKALGVRISLRHTVLIVLGESMLKAGDYDPLIDLFVGNDVSDNTYIIGVETDAKKLFEAKPALYSTISYKIAETFRSPDIESGMVSTNVKDFLGMYLSQSGAIFVPEVNVGKGNMAESNGDGDKDTDSLNFGKIAVLDKGGLKVVLDKRASEGLSYIMSNVNEANVYVDAGEDRDGFDMDIIETMSTRCVSTKKKDMTLDVKMWVKMEGKNSINIDEKKKLAGETIKNSIKSAISSCHEKGVDILNIKDFFWKKMGSRMDEVIDENYLDNIPVNIKVTLIAK